MDDECELEYQPSYPWSWRSSAVAVLQFATNVLQAASALSDHLATQAAADHNYRIDRRDFAEAAALEIENMTTEE